MNDASSTINAPHNEAPAWAIELLERVRALETSSVSPAPATPHVPDMEMDALNNGAVVERTPDLEFTPYPDFIEALPGMARDFFRNPLPERERRRYLAQCPRNMEREYSPPVLNQVHVSQSTKRTDAQLADIQFRLSGLTRPVDYFLHMALQQTSPSKDDFIDFANAIHELLSDTASHITQMRIDNMCQSAGIRGQAPRLSAPTATPLLDPKVLLEHVSLAKSTMQLGRQSQGSQRGKANSSRSSEYSDNRNVASQPHQTNQTNQSSQPPRKDFRRGQHHKDKNPPQSTQQ